VKELKNGTGKVGCMFIEKKLYKAVKYVKCLFQIKQRVVVKINFVVEFNNFNQVLKSFVTNNSKESVKNLDKVVDLACTLEKK
jgi:hypothetical protein